MAPHPPDSQSRAPHPQPPSEQSGAQQSGAPVTYRDAGVDIDAGNALVKAIKPMVAATRRPGADAAIGGFGGLFDLKAAGFTDPVLVAANDGVGTKLKIAIETGRHDTIGIDLVAMCVNDLIVQGAEPLFFLDYFATGHLDTRVATAVIGGISAGCQIAGCALIGGETAEMPGMYGAGDYDLAGFAVGAAERGRLLPRGDLKPGDVLLGLPSSGVHSNGYSLVRRLVADQRLDWAAPAPFAPATTLAEALLAPTRIYVSPVLKVLKSRNAAPLAPPLAPPLASPQQATPLATAKADAHGAGLKALAHITGGGLLENIPRVLPDGLSARIDCSAWQPAPVFGWLAAAGRLDTQEMARTFNCGIGMVLVVAADAVAETIAVLTDAGEAPVRLGDLIARAGPPEVLLDGTLELTPE